MEGTRVAMPVVPDPYDPNRFRQSGHALIDVLADHLEATSRSEGRPLEYVPPNDLLERWSGSFGSGPGRSLAEIMPDLLRWSHHLHHPHYIGHQVSSPLPSAALAELVSALLNNGSAEYEMGPVSNVMERRLIDWLGASLGFPGSVEGLFTSGGSVGNLTALAAARQSIDGLDAWNGGLADLPPLAILASDQAHYSNDRAARILGLGAGGVVTVPSDSSFRLDPSALRAAHVKAEQAGRRVFAVIGSACSTSTGAFDPLDAIADYAAEHGLWFHVDGAHGAVAALSSKYRHLVAGIGRADSVAIDAHKMLQMPALVTAVLFGRLGAADRTFHQEQSYVGFRAEEGAYAWWDSGIRTLECTKRMMALELYASLSEHGTDAFADHITRTFDLARSFAGLLREARDFDVAVEPQANIVCFRHVPEDVRDLDDFQVRIREALVAHGGFYIVKARLPKGMYLRTTIINARTTEDDLRDLVKAIREAGRTVRSSSAASGIR
jgi:L-2,4-diaminobutyrate decarboxylase